MPWHLQYQAIQLSCNCILPWLPPASNTHPPTYCLAHNISTTPLTRYNKEDAGGHYKCTVWYNLHFTLLGLGSTVHRAFKVYTTSSFLQNKIYCNIWIGRAIKLNCHQQMVSISDSRFSFRIPTFLHLVASSPPSLTDSSRRRWNSERIRRNFGRIRAAFRSNSAQDSHWWGAALDLAKIRCHQLLFSSSIVVAFFQICHPNPVRPDWQGAFFSRVVFFVPK